MKLLMIATGYPPYLFSENLCNGKLALALLEVGIEVDVISRVDEGPSYGSEWVEPWSLLKPTANIIAYHPGNKVQKVFDTLYSGLVMGGTIQPGVRWMRRAYQMAMKMISENHYDAILTRSPNDIPHLVGEKIKRKTGILWIANWNDPASPIWPEPYRHNFHPKLQQKKMAETERVLRSADINSFPSDSLRQHFSKHFPFLKQQSTEVFPHIGFVNRFWPKASKRHDCGLDNGKLYFLHSGNLSSERNPETTFQAFRRVIDSGFINFEFHIMGHINNYTTEMIETYGLKDFVRCIGSHPYMEALSIMQSYDVLVLLEAKLEKGIFFASKFTDYLQTGLPILAISPKEGFAVEMLAGKKGEYHADNSSVDSIYETLTSIIQSWQSNNISNCASLEIFSQLSSEVVANQYNTVINRYGSKQ